MKSKPIDTECSIETSMQETPNLWATVKEITCQFHGNHERGDFFKDNKITVVNLYRL